MPLNGKDDSNSDLKPLAIPLSNVRDLDIYELLHFNMTVFTLDFYASNIHVLSNLLPQAIASYGCNKK